MLNTPLFTEIDRVLAEHDGQTLYRAELGSLLRPYAGSHHDGHRWEDNDPWELIDNLVKRGRLLEAAAMTYVVHARGHEPLPEDGPRSRRSSLAD